MPHRPIKEVLPGHPYVCVPADTSVREVTRLMRGARQSGALVSVDGRLAGIFTERDATFRVLAEGLDPEATPVGEVCTRDPVTITDDKPFGHALHMMYEGDFRHVPVVDADGHPIGIVTAHDALGLDALVFGDELVRREEITVIL